jgi:hypothetical protein
MTDPPAPRTRPASTAASRANPAPRRALPRVTPLGAADVPLAAVPAVVAAAPVDLDEDTDDAPELPATGRDLLIPNGAPATRRKGRAAVAVPSLAELMPSPEQRHGKQPKPQQPPPARPEPTSGHRHGKPDKHEKTHKHPADVGKDVELTVKVSKALRKRLKAKATEMGMSPEAAVAQLVEVWVDG